MQTCSCNEIGKDLQHRGIKSGACNLGSTIGFCHSVLTNVALHHIHQSLVLQQDALWFSCGAGSVDDVCKILRRSDIHRIIGALQGDPLIDGIEMKRDYSSCRQSLRYRFLCEQHLHARIFTHECQSLQRVTRIHRQICTAGFQDGEHSHNHLRRTRHANAHNNLRPDTARAQIAGKPVCLFIQLPICQVSLA